MSVQTKKRFKNLGKTISMALFALLIFTNIKIALMDDAELTSGDISVFGIELNLFEPSYAETTDTGCPNYCNVALASCLSQCSIGCAFTGGYYPACLVGCQAGCAIGYHNCCP